MSKIVYQVATQRTLKPGRDAGVGWKSQTMFQEKSRKKRPKLGALFGGKLSQLHSVWREFVSMSWKPGQTVSGRQTRFTKSVSVFVDFGWFETERREWNLDEFGVGKLRALRSVSWSRVCISSHSFNIYRIIRSDWGSYLSLGVLGFIPNQQMK